jgi:NAD(P)-dependent dehydrogenase (short-subunit alcohol dehydrogenase family)
MRLTGKTAVVTGAQQGIGRAIAVALARDGANVAINFLDDEEAAARVADDVRAQARQAILVRGDVSRPADVEAMLATVVRQLGPPSMSISRGASSSPRPVRERWWRPGAPAPS